MFNLLIGLDAGVVPADRMFEYTDDRVRRELGDQYESRIERLPALSMPEIGDDRFEQVATLGRILSLRATGRTHRFDFEPNPRLQPIPVETVRELADRLNVDPEGWEFRRTHWAVKQAELFEVLFEYLAGAPRRIDRTYSPSAAVQFPTDTPLDSKLVAVMMPFDPNFDVVYETIALAVDDIGMKCVRVDNIWEHDHVMGDVLSLLWRARVVVADLTDRNPNVFYETGLAHALPRRTILLTQNPDDVPFDLRSIRYLRYGVGSKARKALREQLSERLKTLSSSRQL
ncbi:hypothetical protein J3D45_003288 [Microbacterium foliorum]|uniref:hypothetical protein n=1 Tax=Microbacterium foliorum TaxID=104336 RepID=UPI00209F053D|nr:hypothetical protein [Microbacterium foliorum]MCP1430790.1 hypothetical protein [Microbacterium foliorum]